MQGSAILRNANRVGISIRAFRDTASISTPLIWTRICIIMKSCLPNTKYCWISGTEKRGRAKQNRTPKRWMHSWGIAWRVCIVIITIKRRNNLPLSARQVFSHISQVLRVRSKKAVLKNLTKQAETFTQAIDYATANPAKQLGIYQETGSISTGKRADFTVLDSDYNVIMTIVAGKIVYSQN